MHDMTNEQDVHIAVVANSCYDFVTAKLLHEQIVDGMSVMGIIEVEVSWKVRLRRLGGDDQDRISNALFWKAGLVDVDGGSIGHEVKVVLLG